MTTIIISNEDVKYIMKIVKSLEKSSLLINEINGIKQLTLRQKNKNEVF